MVIVIFLYFFLLLSLFHACLLLRYFNSVEIFHLRLFVYIPKISSLQNLRVSLVGSCYKQLQLCALTVIILVLLKFLYTTNDTPAVPLIN